MVSSSADHLTRLLSKPFNISHYSLSGFNKFRPLSFATFSLIYLFVFFLLNYSKSGLKFFPCFLSPFIRISYSSTVQRFFFIFLIVLFFSKSCSIQSYTSFFILFYALLDDLYSIKSETLLNFFCSLLMH